MGKIRRLKVVHPAAAEGEGDDIPSLLAAMSVPDAGDGIAPVVPEVVPVVPPEVAVSEPGGVVVPLPATAVIVPEAVVAFDYGALPPEAAATVRAAADGVHASLRQMSGSMMETGRHLIAAKAALPHGQWRQWLAAEFSMCERTARNFMAAVKTCGDDATSAIIAELPPTSVIRLSSASPEVRDEILSRVKSGERLTAAEIDKAVRAAKSPRPAPAASGPSEPPEPATAPAPEPAGPCVEPERRPFVSDLRAAIKGYQEQRARKLAVAIHKLISDVALAAGSTSAKPTARKWGQDSGHEAKKILDEIERLTGREHPARTNLFGKIEDGPKLVLKGHVAEVLGVVADIHNRCIATERGGVGAPSAEEIAGWDERFRAAGQ